MSKKQNSDQGGVGKTQFNEDSAANTSLYTQQCMYHRKTPFRRIYIESYKGQEHKSIQSMGSVGGQVIKKDLSD